MCPLLSAVLAKLLGVPVPVDTIEQVAPELVMASNDTVEALTETELSLIEFDPELEV